MTFFKVLLVLLLVCFLLSRIRLGGIAEYKETVFSLCVIAGPVKINLFPGEKKESEKKAKKPPKEKKTKKAKADGGTAAEKPKRKLPAVGDLILLGLEAAGQLKRKIRIDDLTLHLTWAADDPADTAVGFGKANALMGMIWPLIDNNFHVKKHDLGVAVDFDRKSPDIFARGRLTMTVGQLISLGVRYGIKFLLLWSRSGKALQKISGGNEQ